MEISSIKGTMAIWFNFHYISQASVDAEDESESPLLIDGSLI